MEITRIQNAVMTLIGEFSSERDRSKDAEIMEALRGIEQRLTELENAVKGRSSQPEYLNMSEAEKYTGYSKSTLYTYNSKGILPTYGNGRKVFYRRADLDKLMAESKSKSNEEIAREAARYEINRIEKKMR